MPKVPERPLLCDAFNVEKQIREDCGRLANQKVTVLEGEITDRALLEKLKITDYDHVIVLAYSGLEPQEADAKTLVTLLHLRDIAERDETPFSIVSEMLDLRNRELAEVAGVDDFIVSEHLVSLMMSQLSEDADLFPIFTDIFDPEGSEIYLKPVSDYVETGKPVNFYTVTEAARRRNETAIGYRIVSQSKRCREILRRAYQPEEIRARHLLPPKIRSSSSQRIDVQYLRRKPSKRTSMRFRPILVAQAFRNNRP